MDGNGCGWRWICLHQKGERSIWEEADGILAPAPVRLHLMLAAAAAWEKRDGRK
jgi:hypothetical protein